MINSKCAFVTAIAGVVASFMGDAALAADTEWKLHIVQPASRQEAIAATTFAERVNARTGDAFELTVYPGGSLGVKDPDLLRILPRGNVVQMAMLTPAYLARDEPRLSNALPEGVMRSPEDTVRVMPLLHELYDEVFESWEVKNLGIIMAPTYKLGIFCKEPVNTLEQLRNRKLRVWSRFLSETFSELGVSTTIIPQSELYVAMQTGVVDCSTYYLDAANTTSLYEVAPYWSLITYYPNPMALIASQSAWEELPADVQSVMDEEAEKLSSELIDKFLEDTYESAQAEKFAAGGGEELAPFPEEDRAAYVETARAIWAETAEGIGEETAQSQQELLQSLERAE